MKSSESWPRQTMVPTQPRSLRRPRAASEICVLLIEQEGDDAAVCQYLLQQEGLRVLTARSQREGLQLALDQHPELVVVDATLPDGGGYEFAMELKLTPDLAQVPVVGLSAFTPHANAPEPPPQVFAACLTKPIHRESFSKTIRDLLTERIAQSVQQRRDRALKIPPP